MLYQKYGFKIMAPFHHFTQNLLSLGSGNAILTGMPVLPNIFALPVLNTCIVYHLQFHVVNYTWTLLHLIL